RPQTSLARSQAYIGVMVDDLANRPFDEPYRMLTSRCEYRLLLRPDTARERLGHIAYQNGLIGEENWQSIERERDGLRDMLQALESISILPRADHLSVLNE